MEVASAGQGVQGQAALEPWLIELPWRGRALRPRSGTGSTGEPVCRATGSVLRIGPADETQIAEQLGRTRVRIPILFSIDRGLITSPYP